MCRYDSRKCAYHYHCCVPLEYLGILSAFCIVTLVSLVLPGKSLFKQCFSVDWRALWALVILLAEYYGIIVHRQNVVVGRTLYLE